MISLRPTATVQPLTSQRYGVVGFFGAHVAILNEKGILDEGAMTILQSVATPVIWNYKKRKKKIYSINQMRPSYSQQTSFNRFDSTYNTHLIEGDEAFSEGGGGKLGVHVLYCTVCT